MEDIDSEVKDHGIALHVDNVKWPKTNAHQMQMRKMENIFCFFQQKITMDF